MGWKRCCGARKGGGSMNAPIDLFLSRLEGVRPTPTGHRAFCPAHQRPPHRPGRGRTLSISESSAGGVLVNCHAGCDLNQILGSLGLERHDLFPRQPAGGAAGEGHVTRGLKGWDWWSLASALDATADALLPQLLRVADAERAGNIAAGRRALADAIGMLRGLEQEIRFGRGMKTREKKNGQ